MLMVNEQELEYQKTAAASDMFHLLALSMQLPQKDFASGLLDGSLAEDVAVLFCELGFDPQDIRSINKTLKDIKLNGVSRDDLFSELRREYTRLFNHPTKPAIYIYETLFLYKPEEGDNEKPPLFISPAAMDAERCYKKAGLKMSREINEPGDHMATELEFMMFLYSQKAKAIRGNDLDELARRNEEIEEFDRLHIKRWVKDFFNQCKTVSSSKVYCSIGEIGSLFLTGTTVRA